MSPPLVGIGLNCENTSIPKSFKMRFCDLFFAGPIAIVVFFKLHMHGKWRGGTHLNSYSVRFCGLAQVLAPFNVIVSS